MDKNSKIAVLGASGLIGSAIVRQLKYMGYGNILTPKHEFLDLASDTQVDYWFRFNNPDVVFLCAARVGGIKDNMNYPATYLMDNLVMECNVIKACHQYHCELLFLGSTCIYPKAVQDSSEPMRETDLLTSDLDTSNEGYAIAKIAGLKMVEMYRKQYRDKFKSVMPTNLFGKNDRYNLERSHVLPAMILKLHIAKYLMDDDFLSLGKVLKTYCKHAAEMSTNAALQYLAHQGIFQDRIEFWGTGNPTREFLYSDDCAKACIRIMEMPDDLSEYRNIHINLGNERVRWTIKELALKIAELVEYKGEVKFGDDPTMDGTSTKFVDCTKMKQVLGRSLGSRPTTALQETIIDFRMRAGL